RLLSSPRRPAGAVAQPGRLHGCPRQMLAQAHYFRAGHAFMLRGWPPAIQPTPQAFAEQAMNAEPDPSREERFQQLLAEYLQALDEGHPIDRQELLALNPDLA